MTHLFARVLTFPLLLGAVAAQWSPTAASHLAIGDGPGEQDQVKVVARADGGCYVSWYDNDPNGTPAFGYDVRLQRLDAAGNEVWPHRGVLVADRGFSSTQDYDLAVDLAGNALLAFRDDRFTGTQITAAAVDETGALLWGSNGRQLTNTTDFVAVPKICATSDLQIVVAWAQNADTHVQRLDLGGTFQWIVDAVLTDPSLNLAPSDLHAADNGSAIVALQRSGGFTSPRHLLAQKLDALGAPLWGASPMVIFDAGSLQFGNFPKFVPDGSGGAVFGWYSSSPSLQCWAQRVDALGNPLFVPNGVPASLAAGDRVSPSVAFDPATQSTYLAYTEQNGPQYRIGAQRFDAVGNPLWSTNGAAVTGFGAAATADVNAEVVDGDLMAFWTAEPAFGQDQVFGARLDAAGAVSLAPFAVSSTPAVKYRVTSAVSSLGFAIVAWRDEGAGTADILAQNVLPDGALGGVASAVVRNGAGVNPVCFTAANGPSIAAPWNAEVAHGPTAIVTAMFADLAPIPGVVVPGVGEVLVPFPAVFVSLQVSVGAADTHTLAFPQDLSLVGAFFTAQGVVLDGATIATCNALDLTVGL